MIKAATGEGLFIKNPAQKVTCKIPEGIPKDILTPVEIIQLSKTECGNSQIKRAFLLILNTGLRFVDIIDLKYKHITNGLIMKPQQKTGREVSIDLNNAAINLIGEMGKPDDYLFNLPSFIGCLKTSRSWAAKAGINKKITWHSARHSFATNLLINDTDIKTIAGLLGHRGLKHVDRYVRLVKSLQDKAVNKLEISL